MAYHSPDEVQVLGHHVLKVISDKHTSYIQLDLVRGLGVVGEHVGGGGL